MSIRSTCPKIFAMGMFKWLKRELRSSGRQRSKSAVEFEQVGSPKSKCNGNINDETRDEDYLRKLSKFNEWRSSNVSLRPQQLSEDQTPTNRRLSQVDFRSRSEPGKDIRYSLDNHHMQYRHLEKNDIYLGTPQNAKNMENFYITDRAQTEPKSFHQNNCKNTNLSKEKRELARIDMTFNKKSTYYKNQKFKTRNEQNAYNDAVLSRNLFESPKKWLQENENSEQNSFNDSSPRPESPPDIFYHRNSLPFSKNDETYQWVINRHGEIVEYALPYNERSIDIGKRDLSDIVENDTNSEDSARVISIDDGTFCITHSLNLESPPEVQNQCSNIIHKYPEINSDTYKINRKLSYENSLVTRFGTNLPNDKVAKRLSEMDLKSVTEKRSKEEIYVDEKSVDNSHNQEFLDAIEDLVNIGRRSIRQLEHVEQIDESQNLISDKYGCVDNPNDRQPLKMSLLPPINPHSDLLSCPVVHVSSLSISTDIIISQSYDTILQWKNAKWFDEDICVRTSKPSMIHLHRTQTALARDLHILRNVPHRNIALLMAIAYDDENNVMTVMEPFTVTLYQLLHDQPSDTGVELETCSMFLQQICPAISFLHARGYIHSNISSHSILIHQKYSIAKLSNFDLTVSIEKDYKQNYYQRKQPIKDTEMSENNGESLKCLNKNVSEEDELSNRAFLRRHNSSNKEIRKKSKVIKSFDSWDNCVWGEEQLISDRAVLGHYQWQAPELFWEENSKVRPCVASDIYSLCVVLLECCTVCKPWIGVSSQQLAQKYDENVTIEIPESVEGVYKDIILKGLELNPKFRQFNPSEMMKQLENIQETNDSSNTFVWKKNQTYGSHSRLMNIITNYQENEQNCEKYTPAKSPKELNNTFDEIQNVYKSIESEKAKLFAELDRNKLEFTLEDTKRMTASDFIQQLNFETRDLTNKPDIVNTYDKKIDFINENIFSSPLNASDMTEYYSLVEKSNLNNQNKETPTLNNNTISPIIDNYGKLLTNITPKFYTPLQIPSATPKENMDIPYPNSTNKSHDSIYSFDIEDYELPETPIARNTKIRKNAWLSEQKQKLDATDNLKRTRLSSSFNEFRYHTEKSEESSKIYENIQSITSTPKSKDNISENEENINMQRDLKSRRSCRINNVKTKLNDILAKGLNCGTNCLSTQNNQNSSLNSSITYEQHISKSVRTCSPVKPASHSIETKFVSNNKSPRYSIRSLSPAYNPEAIKPASHQDEHLTILNQKSESPDAKEILENPKNERIKFYENSLWRQEKNKCELKKSSTTIMPPSHIEEIKIEEKNGNNTIELTNDDQKYLLPIPMRFATLPTKVSAKIIVKPERKFFTQVYRKDTMMTKNVMEIAKIFEKRSTGRFIINSNRNGVDKVDCGDFENVQSDVVKSANFGVEQTCLIIEEFNNNDESTPNTVNDQMDESFIYNNALDQGEDLEVKLCSNCGSHINEQTEPRRLSLGPEITEICANILRSSEILWQISDIEPRYLLRAFELAKTPLKRCQAFPAIQNARSTEDLYIDDEFSTEDLGSHMQLSENKNDIFYQDSDLYSINLEENPLSINLNHVNDNEFFDENLHGSTFEPSLTEIKELDEEVELESSL